jgi:glycosyltransferase involved in cell wall biosynthesis
MKIGVIVDNELNKDIRVLREIKILREQGHEIFVLCLAFNSISNKTIPGVTIIRINIKRWIKNLLYFSLNSFPVYEWLWSCRVNRFIREHNIEVAHVHDLYMAKAVHNGIKKTGMKIPMILDLHENYPYTVLTYNWTKGFVRGFISQPQKWKSKEKEYLGYAQKIIVLSNEFRDQLINQYSELSKENFVILPNVPDLLNQGNKEEGIVKYPFKQKFPVVFYFGVIAERRGVFDALRVFTELVKENYPVNFLLIGPIDKKDRIRFLKLIDHELIADRTHYIPWIEFNELGAYLEISDICIAPLHKNPQHESGVANKIYDYMLGSKPVIVSDCLPQQNLIENYKCGLVYKNEKEMKDAIVYFLSNKELRIEMGLNGYNAIIKEFNTDMVKGRLLSLYNTFEAETIGNLNKNRD